MTYYKMTKTEGVLDYELIRGDIADVLDIDSLRDYVREGYCYYSDTPNLRVYYLSTKITKENKIIHSVLNTVKKEKIKKYVKKLVR